MQVLVDFSTVDSVAEINLTCLSELLDHSEGFSANSTFSLLGACATVVSAIDTGMLGKWARPIDFLSRWFAVKNISANPKVLALL